MLPVTGKAWIRFAGNQLLLRRELYPRLFNAFMDGRHFVPKPGALLVLHGFPGYMEWTTMPDPAPYLVDTRVGSRGEARVLDVHLWNAYSELPISEDRERRDPDLYNRIYTIENVKPCAQMPSGGLVRREWVDAKNDISEDECGAFFYDHFFPEADMLIMGNDTDVFMYALMYAKRRIRAGTNAFRNNHILRLPFLKEAMGEEDRMDIVEDETNDPTYAPVDDDEAQPAAAAAAAQPRWETRKRRVRRSATEEEDQDEEEEDDDGGDVFDKGEDDGEGGAAEDADENELDLPRYEYWDVNRLFCMVREDREMSEAGVQNHAAFLVLMMILGECDFLRKHMKGVGKDTIVWPLLLKSMRLFSHIVQVSAQRSLLVCANALQVGVGVTPDTRTPHAVSIDETAFRIMVNCCYAQKFGGPARKRAKLKPNDPALTPAMVRAHCATGAYAARGDHSRAMPDRQLTRTWARQALYYMLLIENGPLGGQYAPDPYVVCPDGLPLFPFVRNPQTGAPEMSNAVSPRGLPVDDVFRQHHFDALYDKGQPTLTLRAPPDADRKRRIVAQFATTK